jgi:signal transduction histidine kinase
MTKGALAEMRTLLVELRPTAVLQLSLHELLSTLADAALSRSRASVNLTIEGDCFLTDDVKIALYRIAQEALNNITKHSEATEINVALICDQKQVVVSICDNGLGFDPEATPPGHFGLAIMRERAEKIGATLLLTSRPGDGTEIVVTWPNNERYQHD